jgi:hypothetical protein
LHGSVSAEEDDRPITLGVLVDDEDDPVAHGTPIEDHPFTQAFFIEDHPQHGIIPLGEEEGSRRPITLGELMVEQDEEDDNVLSQGTLITNHPYSNSSHGGIIQEQQVMEEHSAENIRSNGFFTTTSTSSSTTITTTGRNRDIINNTNSNNSNNNNNNNNNITISMENQHPITSPAFVTRSLADDNNNYQGNNNINNNNINNNIINNNNNNNNNNIIKSVITTSTTTAPSPDIRINDYQFSTISSPFEDHHVTSSQRSSSPVSSPRTALLLASSNNYNNNNINRSPSPTAYSTPQGIPTLPIGPIVLATSPTILRNSSSQAREPYCTVVADPPPVTFDVLNNSGSEPISITEDEEEANVHHNMRISLSLEAMHKVFSPMLSAFEYSLSSDSQPQHQLHHHRSVGVAAVSSMLMMRMMDDNLLIKWAMFQVYGTPDGVTVKGIKTTQVVRVLKMVGVTVTSSQLDLIVTRLHSKGVGVGGSSLTHTTAATSSSSSTVGQSSSQHNNRSAVAVMGKMLKTGTAAVAVAPKQKDHLTGGALSEIKFPAFSELVDIVADSHKVAIGTVLDCWATMLLKRTVELKEYQRMVVESNLSFSGLLLKSSYRKYFPSMSATAAATATALGPVESSHHPYLNCPDIHELELIRQIWDRNHDQIRQIYTFYAQTKDVRRMGHGLSRRLLSYTSCREFLTDFQLLPHVVELTSLVRLFRTCKMWELEVVQCLITTDAEMMTTSHYPQSAKRDAPSSTNRLSPTNSSPRLPSLDDNNYQGNNSNTTASSTTPADLDPQDFKSAVGNLSLTLFGFIELLSRISVQQKQRFGLRPAAAVECVLHIMDASDGKAKLIRAARKSTAIRRFVYGVVQK